MESSNMQLPLDSATPAAPPASQTTPPATTGPTANGPVTTHPQSASPPAPTWDQVKTAKIVSLILHPFLISPLSIVLILWLAEGSLLSALGWAALCAAFVVGPASLYLRDKLRRKQFTDADVSVREHRYGFYIFGGVCMLFCFGVLLWLDAPAVLIAGFTTALVALVVAMAVNRLWAKISIHTGAMAGVTAAAAFYAWPLALLLALGTVAVSWARLVTERHTLLEAVLGSVVAIACVATVFGPLLWWL